MLSHCISRTGSRISLPLPMTELHKTKPNYRWIHIIIYKKHVFGRYLQMLMWKRPKNITIGTGSKNYQKKWCLTFFNSLWALRNLSFSVWDQDRLFRGVSSSWRSTSDIWRGIQLSRSESEWFSSEPISHQKWCDRSQLFFGKTIQYYLSNHAY